MVSPPSSGAVARLTVEAGVHLRLFATAQTRPLLTCSSVWKLYPHLLEHWPSRSGTRLASASSIQTNHSIVLALGTTGYSSRSPQRRRGDRGHKGETERFQVTEEEARIDKRVVPTGRVRIHTAVDVNFETARANLEGQEVEIDRVPVNKPVKETPPVRTKNDTLIIPVMEEVLVVEKQLILKEEPHVRRRVVHKRVEVPVSLRKQRPVVERQNAAEVPQRNRRRRARNDDDASRAEFPNRNGLFRQEGDGIRGGRGTGTVDLLRSPRERQDSAIARNRGGVETPPLHARLLT
jgi:uncharacterized protein (TIGR02271 family)